MGLPPLVGGVKMLQVCEVIYGCKRGGQMMALLEGAMGRPCPCKQGAPCPLMPLDAQVPEQRVSLELLDHVPLD